MAGVVMQGRDRRQDVIIRGVQPSRRAGRGAWLVALVLCLLVGKTTSWSAGSRATSAFASPGWQSAGIWGVGLRTATNGINRDVCKLIPASCGAPLGRGGPVLQVAAKALPSGPGTTVTRKQEQPKDNPSHSASEPQAVKIGLLGGAWGQAAAQAVDSQPSKKKGNVKGDEAAPAPTPEKKKRYRGIGARQAAETSDAPHVVIQSAKKKTTTRPRAAATDPKAARTAKAAPKAAVAGKRTSVNSGRGAAKTRVPKTAFEDEEQTVSDVRAMKPQAGGEGGEGGGEGAEKVKKRRNRGFGSGAGSGSIAANPSKIHLDLGDDVALTDFTTRSESSSSWSDDDDGAQDLANAVSAPPGTRVRSRTAPSTYILPSSPKKFGRGQQGGVPREISRETSDIVRRSLVLTPGNRGRSRAAMGEARMPRSRQATNQVHSHNPSVNPGASPVGRKDAAEDGVVSLAELSRRGLIDKGVDTQSVLASAKDIMSEVRVDMAVFALDMIRKSNKVQLLTAGSDSEMIVWDPLSLEETARLSGHKDWVNAVAVDDKRGFFVSASDDKTVRVWDTKSLKLVTVLDGLKTAAHSLCIGESQLFVGCTANVYVFDIKTWEMQHRLSNHTQVLRAMSSGKQMSKNVEIVDERVLQFRLPTNLFPHRVGGVALKPPFLLTAVDDGCIWVWNTNKMEVERKLMGSAAPGVWVRPLQVMELEDAKTGKKRTKLVSGWADGVVRIFDMKTWKVEKELPAHNGPVLCLDFSDGRLLSTGADMSVLEWDTRTWTVRRVLRGHRGAVCAVTGKNGETYTASLDGFLKKWTKTNSN